MNRQKENEIICKSLHFLKYGKFRERKEYIKKLANGQTVELNGFFFDEDVWSWIIWKPTDIGDNPEYKGEPLCKVVPRLDCDVEAVLNAQSWTHI